MQLIHSRWAQVTLSAAAQRKAATDALRSQMGLKKAGEPCSHIKDHSVRRPTLLTPLACRRAGPAAASSSALVPGIGLPPWRVVKLLCGAEGAAGQVLPCCGSSPSARQCWDPLPRLQLHPGLAFWLSHSSWDQQRTLLGFDLTALSKAVYFTGGCSFRHFPAGGWSPGSLCPPLSSKG